MSYAESKHKVEKPILISLFILQYTLWSLLTLQGTLLGPYLHYRIHSWILTNITGYTPGSLLTSHGTLLGPY